MENFLKTYFKQNNLEALIKVEMSFKRRFYNHYKGIHKSHATGKNIDFKEHRVYAQGDDINLLDWKLFARTEKLYIKQFEETVSCKILVILDKSASMAFSANTISDKLEYGKYLFALMYSFFIKQGDSVSLSIFDEKIHSVFPFYRTGEHIPNIDTQLRKIEAKGITDFASFSSQSTKSAVEKPDIIFILSDMIASGESVLQFIKDIKTPQNEVIFFQLVESSEELFNFSGERIFYDNETGKEILLNTDNVKEMYLNYFHKHVDSIIKNAEKHGCLYYKFRVDIPYFENFMNFLKNYRKN